MIVFAIIILGLFITSYQKPQKENMTTISVTGNAEMKVPPDIAVIYAEVLTRSNFSAEDAKNSNSKITDAILNALIKINLNKSNIETFSFNVYPEYDWTEEGRILKGYIAIHTMKITFSNFDEAGKTVDVIVDNGGLINS